MSRNINVNPGQYKIAGRERQGEDVEQTLERQRYAQLRRKPSRGPRALGTAAAKSKPAR